MWSLELRLTTSTVQHGPLSWGDGLPLLILAGLVRIKDSHSLVCALELWLRTRTLHHGLLSWC